MSHHLCQEDRQEKERGDFQRWRRIHPQGGGYILNTVTKKKLRFVERNGVYFIKLKILETSEKKMSGFARPGP